MDIDTVPALSSFPAPRIGLKSLFKFLALSTNGFRIFFGSRSIFDGFFIRNVIGNGFPPLLLDGALKLGLRPRVMVDVVDRG